MTVSIPTIADTLRAFRAGNWTPRDLLEQCLERIRLGEDRVHAWVVVDAAGARRRAEELTRLGRREASCAPLFGIPVGIKDIVDVRGLPTRAGSRSRPEIAADDDAPLVSRLRAAGAVILGKTVTTEFACFDPPPTRNPWHLGHTPGGSSSGSAAAVSLGMCLAAVGTQTGGSIIRPAGYCGVAGLKPSFGSIPVAGVVPVSPHLDHAGFIASCVEDLARIFFASAEPALDRDTGDTQRWLQRRDGGIEPPPVRVLERPFFDQCDPDVRIVTEEAMGRLPSRRLDTPDLDWLAEVLEHHRCIMAVEVARQHRDLYVANPAAFGPRIAGLIAEGLATSPRDYDAALRHQAAFRRRIESLFADEAIAMLPATNTPAPARLDTTGDPSFNSPWSYAGVPAVTIPCGLTVRGMPSGLQLVGPPGSEFRLLLAAAWCEERLGFSAAPPLLAEMGNRPAGVAPLFPRPSPDVSPR